MMPSDRLDYLFVRHWDGSISRPERMELANAIRNHPARARQFQILCEQAVLAAELSGTIPCPPDNEHSPLVSRRRALLFGAAACSVGVFATLGSAWLWKKLAPAASAMLSVLSGRVFHQSRLVFSDQLLTPGDTIQTDGSAASAVVRYPDGSQVMLTGDTTVTFEDPYHFTIHRGGVSAVVPDLAKRLMAKTPEMTATPLQGETLLTIARGGRRTDVGVFRGKVELQSRNSPTITVKSGEYGSATVQDSGKQSLAGLPDEYRWDVDAPLPPGWCAGWLDQDEPSIWAEPFIDKSANEKDRLKHYQVRGENGWSRGLVRLHPESLIRARFMVQSPASVMTMLVVRPDPPEGPNTCCLLHWHDVGQSQPGVWQSIAVRVRDLQHGRDRPFTLTPPWLMFVAFITTLDRDAGLRVAEFDITRPLQPGDG